MNSSKYIIFILLCFGPFVVTSIAQDMTINSIKNEPNLEPMDLFKLPEVLSTASISKVAGETLEKTPVSNLFDTMYGLFPGLYVSQGGGTPGFEGTWMRIRGIGSYNYGSYAVFVDGFQTESSYINYLSPNEIESVSVFKDGAALATFGMKGANGVVWIETKRGIISKPQIKMNVKYGIQQPMNIYKPLNSYDYTSFYNEATSNDQGAWLPKYSEQELLDYKEGIGINTDWYDEVFKQSSSFMAADASVTGGSDLAKYFVLFDYKQNDGFYNVKTDDRHANAQLRQFNIRTNFDFKLFDFIEGKVDLGGRVEKRRRPAYSGTSLWYNLQTYPNNIYPVINEDKTYPGTAIYPDNPLASIRELGYYSNSDRSLQANFYLKENLNSWVRGLYLDQSVSFNNWTRGSYTITKDYARIIDGVAQTTNKNTNYSIYDDYGTNQWQWIHFKTGVGYDKEFGLNKIKTSMQYLYNMKNVDASLNSAGNHINYAFMNISGRVNYAYDDRYVGEFGYSVSGSDNYAKGNQFGFYPAVSVAWLISNEDFINKSTVNFLKLRASVGRTGYDGLVGPRYSYKQYFEETGSIPLGNSSITWPSGYDISYTANPNIFAEQSLKYNLGIDAELWNSISITLDGFVDKRSGIISQDYNYMSDSYGISPPYTNAGKVTTSGLEASVFYSKAIRDFSFTLGGNVSYYKDIIDYMPELTPASTEAWNTGNSIGTRFGYDAIGFYDVTDFETDGSLKSELPLPLFGNVQPGDIKYRDLNEDKIIDQKDILKIGAGDIPKLSYALMLEAKYKFVDFRVLVQGASQRDINILSQARSVAVAYENNKSAFDIIKGRWAYYPEQGIDTRETANYPRLSTADNNNNYRSSNFWIKDGSFLRLRNIELGFNLNKKILSKMNIEQARVYFVGVNLFTYSPLLRDYNLDPEALAGLPANKSYNIGLSFHF